MNYGVSVTKYSIMKKLTVNHIISLSLQEINTLNIKCRVRVCPSACFICEIIEDVDNICRIKIYKFYLNKFMIFCLSSGRRGKLFTNLYSLA